MTSYQDFWTDTEIKELGMALTFAYKMSDTYSKPLELQHRIQAWKMTLEDDFYMHEVLAAIVEHMKYSREMVMPCDVRKIISPEPKNISISEYNAALDWQKRNNHPLFSDAKKIIEKFEIQEKELRECQKIEITPQIKKILSTSLPKA